MQLGEQVAELAEMERVVPVGVEVPAPGGEELPFPRSFSLNFGRIADSPCGLSLVLAATFSSMGIVAAWPRGARGL